MLQDYSYVIAGYGEAAQLGLQELFSHGINPCHVAILTYQSDSRNDLFLKYAERAGSPVFFFEKGTENQQLASWIERFSPKILISLHFRHRISRQLYDRFEFGGINLHPSLLPKYKGCMSIPWAIINGEKETGFTYHFLNESFDEGNIIFQQATPIDSVDTAFSLFTRLNMMGARALPSIVLNVLQGDRGKIMDHVGASYYSRELPHEGYIDRAWSIDQAERFIRAMVFPPFKGALLRTKDEVIEIQNIDGYLELQN